MREQSPFILTWDFQEPLPTWHLLIWAWFPGSWIRFLNALQSSAFWGKIAACHSILIFMSLIFLAASCNLEPKLLNFLSTATSVAWTAFKLLLKIKHKQYIKTTLRVWLMLTEARKLKCKASHCICTRPLSLLASHHTCQDASSQYQELWWTVKTQTRHLGQDSTLQGSNWAVSTTQAAHALVGEQGFEDSVWLSPPPKCSRQYQHQMCWSTERYMEYQRWSEKP